MISTSEGKSLISTYLAAHVTELKVCRNICLNIDTELYLEGCFCDSGMHVSCTCAKYAVPIRCKFGTDAAAPVVMKLNF